MRRGSYGRCQRRSNQQRHHPAADLIRPVHPHRGYHTDHQRRQKWNPQTRQFVWHAHENEDEMFLVVYGTLRIQLEARPEVTLGPGEFFVVPRGLRHNPIAEEEVGIVLIETVSTLHTGDVQTDRSVPVEKQLG